MAAERGRRPAFSKTAENIITVQPLGGHDQMCACIAIVAIAWSIGSAAAAAIGEWMLDPSDSASHSHRPRASAGSATTINQMAKSRRLTTR
jgi:hypothetical protein